MNRNMAYLAFLANQSRRFIYCVHTKQNIFISMHKNTGHQQAKKACVIIECVKIACHNGKQNKHNIDGFPAKENCAWHNEKEKHKPYKTVIVES